MRFVAIGAACFSTFVGVAGGGNSIVVINAVLQEDGKDIGRLRGDIAKLLRGKKPTVNLKIAVGMV